LLDRGDFGNCLDEQNLFVKSMDPNYLDKILGLMFEINEKLNLADYVFVRRVNLVNYEVKKGLEKMLH
jgi:hypothetical protein